MLQATLIIEDLQGHPLTDAQLEMQENALADIGERNEATIRALVDTEDCTDVQALKAVLFEAIDYDLSTKSSFEKARGRLNFLEKQQEARARVVTSLESDDLETVVLSLQDAYEAGIDTEANAVALQLLLSALARKKHASEVLHAAVQMQNPQDVQIAYNAAQECGVGGEHMTHAHVLLERHVRELEAVDTLKTALTDDSLELLGEALCCVINEGITGPLVSQAEQRLAELERRKRESNKLTAAIGLAALKSATARGLQLDDIVSLQEAINQCKAANGFPDAIATAEVALAQFNKQLAVQTELEAAVNSRDLLELERAIIAGRQFDHLTVVNTAQMLLVKLDADLRGMNFVPKRRRPSLAPVTMEASSNARVTMSQYDKTVEASDARYHFSNFPYMRSVREFVQPFTDPEDVSTIGDIRFRYQPFPLHKSLTWLNLHANKAAIDCNIDILSFCGEYYSPFSLACVVELLGSGYEDQSSLLREEIFLQLCKHLTGNPSVPSTVKAWKLFALCLNTFPPTTRLEPFLRNFILAEVTPSNPLAPLARAAYEGLERSLLCATSTLFLQVSAIEQFLRSAAESDSQIRAAMIAANKSVFWADGIERIRPSESLLTQIDESAPVEDSGSKTAIADLQELQDVFDVLAQFSEELSLTDLMRCPEVKAQIAEGDLVEEHLQVLWAQAKETIGAGYTSTGSFDFKGFVSFLCTAEESAAQSGFKVQDALQLPDAKAITHMRVHMSAFLRPTLLVHFRNEWLNASASLGEAATLERKAIAAIVESVRAGVHVV
jgi:hypothetical protein